MKRRELKDRVVYGHVACEKCGARLRVRMSVRLGKPKPKIVSR